MRRPFSPLILLLCTVGVVSGGQRALANLASDLAAVEALVNGDLTAANSYTCGGLMYENDERVKAYYRRLTGLTCALTEWCNRFDETTNLCTGSKCTLFHWDKQGVPVASRLEDCDDAGNCTPLVPSRTCFSYYVSTRRHYECWNPLDPTETASKDCYSYMPTVHYSQSYFPFAFNCVTTFTPSPVGTGVYHGGVEPEGQLSLAPPQQSRPAERKGVASWEPVRGSTLAVPSDSTVLLPPDDSMQVLHIDEAATAKVRSVVQVAKVHLGQLTEYPDLQSTIGSLMDPPQVRLVLPTGGLSLSHSGSNLFSAIFSTLTGNEQLPIEKHGAFMTVTLGSNSDALQLASELLRSTPLLEVRYVPVTVLVPHAEESSLQERILEWELWRDRLNAMASDLSLSVDAALIARVNENISVMRSYIALLESLREYRLHFPSYLDALLSYVEDANRFFRKEWVEVNASRLEDWHTAYRSYLSSGPSGLRARLRSMQTTAAAYTSNCLANACRAYAIPVLPGTEPWEFFPPDAGFVLGGTDPSRVFDGAWHPEAFPLWQNAHGLVGLNRPPGLKLGSPLPDITLDFSELLQKRAIPVPVISVEVHPLRLQSPPALNREDLAYRLREFMNVIGPLPRMHPPLFSPSGNALDLTFPDLTLPDPATSLFLVPEAPIPLGLWSEALDWRERRLSDVMSTCDTSATPTTFLIHELQKGFGGPAIKRRAAALVGGRSMDSFSLDPMDSWMARWGLRIPRVCTSCRPRPERTIKQHVQLEASWQRLEETLLTAVDEWNAQVRFVSIAKREELEEGESEREVREELPALLNSFQHTP